MPFQNVNQAFDDECEQYSGISSTLPILQAGSANISIMCRYIYLFRMRRLAKHHRGKPTCFKETKLMEEGLLPETLAQQSQRRAGSSLSQPDREARFEGCMHK